MSDSQQSAPYMLPDQIVLTLSVLTYSEAALTSVRLYSLVRPGLRIHSQKWVVVSFE